MGSTPYEVILYNSMYLILPATSYPEVCTASNINEYQKTFCEAILVNKTKPENNLTTN
jgi:hypothetical protein